MTEAHALIEAIQAMLATARFALHLKNPDQP
jgi:hypothetical protein